MSTSAFRSKNVLWDSETQKFLFAESEMENPVRSFSVVSNIGRNKTT